MKLTPKVQPSERGRLGLLAFLFFVNALVLESNEVVSTSGFVSNVAVSAILVVWAVVALIALLTSGAYSLFVDRVHRGRLAVGILYGFGVLYLLLYVAFRAQAPDYLTYGFLAIFTEQQWTLLPLLIWALANDVFSVAEAKRLFPILSGATLLGSIAGNSLAASLGLWFRGSSYSLLVLNAALVLAAGTVLLLFLTRLRLGAQPSVKEDGLADIVREGLTFVREIPAYRYLAVTMMFMGVALNTIEYQFLLDVTRVYQGQAQIETFYGVFKLLTIPVLLVLQAGVLSWLLKHLGFRSIFAIMPAVMLLSVTLALFWISPLGGFVLVTGAIVGDYLARVARVGVDQPSSAAFLGLVPDQRRGRVSAFMDGFLYPLGSLLGCLVIGAILIVAQWTGQTPLFTRTLYLVLAFLCAAGALVAILAFNRSYDVSMLNYRLKRRKRGRSVLDDIAL